MSGTNTPKNCMVDTFHSLMDRQSYTHYSHTTPYKSSPSHPHPPTRRSSKILYTYTYRVGKRSEPSCPSLLLSRAVHQTHTHTLHPGTPGKIKSVVRAGLVEKKGGSRRVVSDKGDREQQQQQQQQQR